MTHDPDHDFIRHAMETLATCQVVLDVGGGERFGKWLSEYKPLFEQVQYKTFDYDVSTGADVIGDIHSIPLDDNSIDGIICSSVLEHVRDPLTAMSELTRVLKPGGYLFLYVPSLYPYHARIGHYPDYWRFFEDTIQLLFRDYLEVSIKKRGGYFRALSFFVPYQHKWRRLLDRLAQVLDALLETERRSTTAGYYVLARK